MARNESLLKLQQLTNLEVLDLNSIITVTEAVIAGIAYSCPKLRDFYISCKRTNMPENERPTLQPIQTALQEGRLSNLEMLDCRDSGIDPEAIDAFTKEFPQINFL